MKVKKSVLWVSYRAQASNGMQLVSDGFFDGTLPLTPLMLNGMKGGIVQMTQAQLDTMKPVDNQGKLIVGVPKAKIQLVEITNILPAEIEEDVPDAADATTTLAS